MLCYATEYRGSKLQVIQSRSPKIWSLLILVSRPRAPSLFHRFCYHTDPGAMGSSSNGVVGERSAGGNGSLQVDKGVDFAQYFCTYAFLYHQKEMLCDRVRMDAYFNAIFKNKHHFEGKVRLCYFLSRLSILAPISSMGPRKRIDLSVV